MKDVILVSMPRSTRWRLRESKSGGVRKRLLRRWVLQVSDNSSFVSRLLSAGRVVGIDQTKNAVKCVISELSSIRLVHEKMYKAINQAPECENENSSLLQLYIMQCPSRREIKARVECQEFFLFAKIDINFLSQPLEYQAYSYLLLSTNFRYLVTYCFLR